MDPKAAEERPLPPAYESVAPVAAAVELPPAPPRTANHRARQRGWLWKMLCTGPSPYEPVPSYEEAPPELTEAERAAVVRQSEIRRLFHSEQATFTQLAMHHHFGPREICETLGIQTTQQLCDAGFVLHLFDPNNTKAVYSWSARQWDEILDTVIFDWMTLLGGQIDKLTPLWVATTGMDKRQIERVFGFQTWSFQRKRAFFSDANVARLSNAMRLSERAMAFPLLHLSEQEWGQLANIRLTDGVHLNFRPRPGPAE